jgi:hypothetical protein
MKLNEDLLRVMGDSVRSYFAPLTGAFKGIRQELRRVDNDAKLRRERKSHPEQSRPPASFG